MAKVAVVTGGGRGIGAAVSRMLAEHGYDIAINYRANAQAAAAVVGDIERRGGRAVAVQGDVASEQDVLKLFDEAESKLGRISALVNNAGILNPMMRFEGMQVDRLNRIFSVNVIGTMLCAREAVRRMSTATGGSGGAIVNLSSVAATTGGPGEATDYAATKGAIDSFTHGLGLEVARQGIRVNAVRPGLIDTEIHQSAERTQRMVQIIPPGRVGTADEVAAAVVWLLSDAASYVNGSLLDVTGGR